MALSAVNGSPVPLGAKYRTTCFVKGAPGADGHVKVHEALSDGGMLSVVQNQAALDGGWQKLDYTYTVQGDASIRVNFGITADPADAGCMNVDDICVTRVQ